MYFGFLSLLPPVIAIILAIRTKQVFLSLIFGIWLGWLAVTFFQYHGIERLSEFGEATKDTSFAEGIVMPLEVLFEGTLNTIQALVDVFKDDGNTRTIFFCALVGALIIFIQRSGGVEGFIGWINKILVKYEARKEGSNRIIVQLMAWFFVLDAHWIHQMSAWVQLCNPTIENQPK